MDTDYNSSYNDVLEKIRVKDRFFREYRHEWSGIFGRMSRRQEEWLWKLWNKPKEKQEKT
tara:strand:+ start:244 stop:423 length:180 start_codon:yes stop_codon:yes gene_type:complete